MGRIDTLSVVDAAPPLDDPVSAAEALLASVLVVGSTQRCADKAAHALFHRFGDLASIMRASREKLEQTQGVGDAMARTIEGIHATHVQIMRDGLKGDAILRHPTRLVDYCTEALMNASVSTAQVFFLRQGALVFEDAIVKGDMHTVAVHVREVMKTAMLRDCDGIVLVLGRKTGDAEHTLEETEVARRLEAAGAALSVKLHRTLVIVTD